MTPTFPLVYRYAPSTDHEKDQNIKTTESTSKFNTTGTCTKLIPL